MSTLIRTGRHPLGPDADLEQRSHLTVPVRGEAITDYDDPEILNKKED
jgi:hypothetical protein